ncbi:hypothetical protein [Alteromonas stellipolaris]|uniref:Uncharacterized protein n=1 Tax=Alteromonas stellipolaris TaxID=233316 RepID=A0ABN4LJF0_9ALTE|nr:hypothetical protein [Alteromonas stellipolaris]AMJ73491.1 hypothetical protein AVL57_05575 [Alteromonas stellipolaris]
MRHSSKAKVLQRIAALEQSRTRKTNKPIALFPERTLVEHWGRHAAAMQIILKQNVIEATPPDYGELRVVKLIPHT